MSVKATLQGRLKGMRPSEAEVARRLLRNLGSVAPPRGSSAIAPRSCQLAVLDALFNRVGRFSK